MSSFVRHASLAAVAVLLSAVGVRGAPPLPGDPTEGRNPLTDDLAGLADLNLSPDFNLTVEQKRRIAAVRTAFDDVLAKWRADHAADFAKLRAAGEEMERGRGGREQWMAFSRQRQDVLATLPEVNASLDQITAVLTDPQREQLQGRTKAAGATGVEESAAAFSPVPADGVPKAHGFYRMRFAGNVAANGEAGGGGVPRPVRMTYLLYLPVGYDPAKGPYPTVLFLHGIGECGTDGSGCLVHGPGQQLWERAGTPFARDFPMVVVMPQCPPRGESWEQPLMQRAALGVLDDAAAKVRVDADRVYLTGLSMGGRGTWLVAGMAPDRFAAIAPMAADTLDVDLARRVRHEPVWAVDGAEDDDGAPENNRRMAAAVRAAGGDVRLDILPGVGHECWDGTYADPKFYDWLLAHRRLTADQRRQRDAAATTRPAR